MDKRKEAEGNLRLSLENKHDKRACVRVCVCVCTLLYVFGFHQIKRLFIPEMESKHLLLSILPCDPSHCLSLGVNLVQSQLWCTCVCGNVNSLHVCVC